MNMLKMNMLEMNMPKNEYSQSEYKKCALIRPNSPFQDAFFYRNFLSPPSYTTRIVIPYRLHSPTPSVCTWFL